MHVAFINPQGNFDARNSYLAAHPDFGGQLVYVRELARELGRMGHEVDIVTRRVIDPAYPEFSQETDSYPEHPNVRILRIPCGPDEFLPKEELWPYLGEWTAGVASRYQEEGVWPDVWTGHYADGGLAAARLSEVSGAPFTFTGHSLGAWKLDPLLDGSNNPDALAQADRGYNFGARVAAERAAMARSAVIVANSAAERSEQYAHPVYRDLAKPGDEKRFAVISPGVNLEIFAPEARSPWEDEVRTKIQDMHERDIAPERRGLPAVIAWSRLDPKKNHLALVEAFACSPELKQSANLLMITRGLEDPLRDSSSAPEEQREVLNALVSEVDLSSLWGSVTAFSLSGQTSLAALYRWGVETGGVFCLPAEYEPFGMTVIEAMAVGLPVVATSNGGPRETTDSGKAGLLADPYDPDDIAGKLMRLISDHDVWQNYAVRGRERAVERYSWSSTAESYLALFKEISAGQRTGDESFPLPEFIRESSGSPAKLPRLLSWETASGNEIQRPVQ